LLWVLISTTNTHHLLTRVYTHLPNWGEKLKFWFWYKTLVFNVCEIFKTHILNYHFLLILSWKLSILWCFRNTCNCQLLILSFPPNSLILNFLLNWNASYLKIQITTKHWFPFSNKMVAIKILPKLYVK
jgi:hypothetical protein